MAQTMARMERPAKKPVWMPSAGMNIEATRVMIQAATSLVRTRVPDFRSTVPVAESLIEAPMQKNHTARIGITPVMMPWVKPLK